MAKQKIANVKAGAAVGDEKKLSRAERKKKERTQKNKQRGGPVKASKNIDKVNVYKFKRQRNSFNSCLDRIDRHNFPVQLEYQGEIEAQQRDGVYDKDKLKEGYYYDVNCCRPYSKYKDTIDTLISIVLNSN